MSFITSVLKIVAGIITTFIIIILLIAWAWPSKEETQATINSLHEQTARDLEQQYAELQRTGASQMDLCVRAGFVAEAYLQANASTAFEKWQNIENNHCQKAGLNF